VEFGQLPIALDLLETMAGGDPPVDPFGRRQCLAAFKNLFGIQDTGDARQQRWLPNN
jgi:hypothetical protein